MPEAYKLQQILTGDESAFAENSSSFDGKLRFDDATFTPKVERIPNESRRERLAIVEESIIGARSGDLSVNMKWNGHGGTAAGALTETWQQRLLGDLLGGNDVSAVGTTCAAGSTTTVVNVATGHGADFNAGDIIRIGAKKDGRADGQVAVVASVSTDALTLINALPGAPNAADVVYACQLFYHDESKVVTPAMASKRFNVMHAVTGAQHTLYGACLSGMTFTIPQDGGIPMINASMSAAYVDRVATTFPNTAITLPEDETAPVMGGSLVFQNIGTTTRKTEDPGDMSLTYALGLNPQHGSGCVHPYQNIKGWGRTACRASLELVIPWETEYETWWDTDNTTRTDKYILWQANTEDSRCYGFYMRKVQPAGPRPNVPVNHNEQCYVRVQVDASEDTSGSNELTKAAVVFFSC